MTAGQTLTEALQRRILTRLNAGETQTDIARDLHLNRATVGNVARRGRVQQQQEPPRPTAAQRVPGNRRPDLDWMGRAACRTLRNFTEAPVAEQQEVCGYCPVTPQCREHGETGYILGGNDVNAETDVPVYAGLDPVELAKRQRQRRAR